MKKIITLITGLTCFGALSCDAQELSGLVAKYSFNSGNANDEVGSVNGTVNGAVLTDDRFGNPNKAYAFNTSNATQIIIPDAVSNSFTNTESFTFAFWVKFGILNPTNALVAGKGLTDGTWNGYSFFSNNTDLGYCNGQGILMLYTASGGMQDACADNLIANNFADWQFIAGRYDGTSQMSILSIDGITQADTGSISGTLDANSDLYLGGYPANPYNNFFSGSIDDIRIFNRVLTDDEILELYNESDPTLGLKELSQATLTLAPNPAKGQVTITSKTPTTVSVQNVLGEEVRSLQIQDTHTLDLSTYSSGIYLLSTTTGETLRLIVE